MALRLAYLLAALVLSVVASARAQGAGGPSAASATGSAGVGSVPVSPWATAADPPVVVVIEASGTTFDVARIRYLVQSQLGMPVASILEAGGRTTAGTLAVAVTSRGRHAAINFVPADGTRFAIMLEVDAAPNADRHGEWLVAPLVSAVRTSLERRQAVTANVDVLDPWISSRMQPGATREVIDPWVGTPPRRVRVELVDLYLGDEILDPWADAVSDYRSEQAERLSRPSRPGRPSRPTRAGAPARRAPRAPRTPAPTGTAAEAGR